MQAQSKTKKTILAVFAHPDDEAAIGPVLSKYARQHKVYLVIATDGRYGTREHAGIPAGDSLARIRTEELKCSAKELGLQPPVNLGFHDGLGTRTGIGEFFTQSKLLKEQLKKKIEEINPAIIITFGPDGDTGHSDHRIIGDITTEILLREGWVERFPLYYVAWSKKQLAAFHPSDLNYMNDKYISAAISFSIEDEERSWASLKCHKSQITESEINEWIQKDKAEKTNTYFFRRFAVDKKNKKLKTDLY